LIFPENRRTIVLNKSAREDTRAVFSVLCTIGGGLDGPLLPVSGWFRAWRCAMKQDRKTKRVDVNTFDNWANFMLRGFVGKQPDGYHHRDDGWDDETTVMMSDAPEKEKKTN
jgi:hypothetical protein